MVKETKVRAIVKGHFNSGATDLTDLLKDAGMRGGLLAGGINRAAVGELGCDLPLFGTPGAGSSVSILPIFCLFSIKCAKSKT